MEPINQKKEDLTNLRSSFFVHVKRFSVLVLLSTSIGIACDELPLLAACGVLFKIFRKPPGG
jgi:hypothetical protein